MVEDKAERWLVNRRQLGSIPQAYIEDTGRGEEAVKQGRGAANDRVGVRADAHFDL